MTALTAALADIGILLVALSISQIAFLTATFALAKVISAPMEEIHFFFGPRLFRLSIMGVPLNVGIIPVSAAVRFTSRQSEEGQDELGSRFTFQDLSLASQIALILAGPIGLGLLSASAIGFAQCWRHTTTAFPQLILGVLHPATQGADLVAKFFAVWEAAPFEAIGIFAAKNLACCLLPLPTTSTFGVVDAITTRLIGAHRPKWYHAAFAMLFLVYLLFLVGWTIPICLRLAAHFMTPVGV